MCDIARLERTASSADLINLALIKTKAVQTERERRKSATGGTVYNGESLNKAC